MDDLGVPPPISGNLYIWYLISNYFQQWRLQVNEWESQLVGNDGNGKAVLIWDEPQGREIYGLINGSKKAFRKFHPN